MNKFHLIKDIQYNELIESFREPCISAPSNDVIVALLESEIISSSNLPSTISQTNVDGYADIRWIRPPSKENPTKQILIKSFFQVAKTCVFFRQITFEKLVLNLNKNSGIPLQKSFGTTGVRIDMIVAALNTAFICDITNNKCLSYSYSLVKLARSVGVQAKLVIGVRTNPFISHAWVEIDDRPLPGEQSFRKTLSVILEA